MRFQGSLGVLCCCMGLAACTDGKAATRDTEGQLVLELGGPHGSLRQALQTAGVTLGPAMRLQEPADPAESGDGAQKEPGSGDAGANATADPPQPPPVPEPVPEPDAEPYVVVTLAERQTLIHLARKYLGDANRFREILTLNGWSEADSRRLLPGQRVKIPRSDGGRPAGR
jgi:nucleoid-associated protein YgaU